MPLVLPKNLPAYSQLESENIFVMHMARAKKQDIRPLKIVLVNLMPTKIQTETQLARVLANSPLQVEISLLHMDSHESKNVSGMHLQAFYKTLNEIKTERFDGMIITGAPVEKMPFEQVDYWGELCEIMEFSKKNVYSTFHICWGAQAALYYHYNIGKTMLSEKLSGIYKHTVMRPKNPLMRGFDEEFFVPHSRYTKVDESAVINCDKLRVLAQSKQAGLHLLSTENGRQIFAFGHMEYDKHTLQEEYKRDIAKNANTKIPENYFKNNDVNGQINYCWRAHAQLLFSNWLNYYVYQNTPYSLEDL